MGAAPVLIMLAAVGVDYGWQPDGTTSQRGDNIEYIVQISPDQLQQLRSIGDITSSIDPSIQGRVSRIIVKVGSGDLPHDAGRVVVTETSTGTGKLAQGSTSSVGSGDDQVVPIPEISDALAAHSGATNPLRHGVAASTSAAVMKPDPQSGFQMPDNSAAAGQSALDQIRRNAVAASPPNNQTRNALDPPSAPFAPAASEATGRDNRWADISDRAAAIPGGGPSTAPVDPAARTASPWSDFVGPLQPTDPRLMTNSAVNNPATANPYANPTNSAINPAASSSPSREPVDPKWSNYGSNTNFGSLPGSNAPRTGYDATAINPAATTSNAAGSRPATNTSSLPAGYTSDSQGNLFDTLGRPIDRYGRLLDPNTAAPAGAQTPTDRYTASPGVNASPLDPTSRRTDEYLRATDPRLAFANGQLPGTQQPSASQFATQPPTYGATNPPYAPNYPGYSNTNPPAPYSAAPVDRFGPTSPYDPLSYGQSTSPQPPLASASSAAVQPAAQRVEQELAAARAQLRNYQQRDAQSAQTRLTNFEDRSVSASDQQATAVARDRIAQDRNAPLQKPRTVSGQAFFNFVLLISFVGNAYLIFETNNLRRKFRNMISSVRSSKVTAQPVA